MGNFSELIREFGRTSGIGDIGLTEGKAKRLVIDGELALDLELGANGEVLLVASTILAGGEEATQAALMLAMQMNLDLARSGGAFLAYDMAGDTLLLLRRFEDRAMRYSDFEPALLGFVAYAGVCRQAMAELIEDDPDFGDDDDEDADEEGPQDTGRVPAGGDRDRFMGAEGEVVFRL